MAFNGYAGSQEARYESLNATVPVLATMSGSNPTAADIAKWRPRIEHAIATGERAEELAKEVLHTLQGAKELHRTGMMGLGLILTWIVMIRVRKKTKVVRQALDDFQGQLDQLGLKHGAKLGEAKGILSEVVFDPTGDFVLGLRVDGAIIRARATIIRLRSALEKLHGVMGHLEKPDG